MQHYEEDLLRAEKLLRTALDDLSREITDYPSPISGCDAQFTRLLSDRRRINDALYALQSEPFVATPRALDPYSGIEQR
ncbi:MAG: hypothetical protein AAGD34_19840 [Pseudomonadota bacterium]